jgi:hypothetical protein
MEPLCLWGLCLGNLERGGGGPCAGDPEEYIKEGSGNLHLSSNPITTLTLWHIS